MARVHPAHRQTEDRLRLEWGLHGAEAVATGVDVAVVVDVLSFTTTVGVAVERGVAVLPHPGGAGAGELAVARDAVLAVPRSTAGSGEVSLSPVSVRVAAREGRLPGRFVLPSPNGSTVCAALADEAGTVVAGSLRNAHAVAGWLTRGFGEDGAVVAVVPAGERWPDGSLRPAAEDLWGAGAVVAALLARGWTGASPEAELAAAAWQAVRPRAREALRRTASGRELVERGYAGDVEVAAEVGVSDVVPVLVDGAFRASATR